MDLWQSPSHTTVSWLFHYDLSHPTDRHSLVCTNLRWFHTNLHSACSNCRLYWCTATTNQNWVTVCVMTCNAPSSLLPCTTAVCSASCSQQPPEWPGLSHLHCFSQSKLVGLEVLWDCLYPRHNRTTTLPVRMQTWRFSISTVRFTYLRSLFRLFRLGVLKTLMQS